MNCTALKSIALPHSLTSIGARAFWSCTALESVALPEGLVSIEEFAFARCTALSTINIPASVQRIGKYAFFGTSIDDATYARIRDLDEYSYESD